MADRMNTSASAVAPDSFLPAEANNLTAGKSAESNPTIAESAIQNPTPANDTTAETSQNPSSSFADDLKEILNFFDPQKLFKSMAIIRNLSSKP
ncbi:hypothetical protein NPIL_61041 [Nephila pilipes]|uniref:Uncharacterized protein n=1 Tax=Nephila pilipes TaxID=299642 RepID=A0A8X6NQR6_NEPPI|nr:hypothetical protein NPIL_61041 [Nephila pilipes]